VHRFELRATVARIIRLLMRPRLDGEAADAAERPLAMVDPSALMGAVQDRSIEADREEAAVHDELRQ
jgi:hypothetical protein